MRATTYERLLMDTVPQVIETGRQYREIGTRLGELIGQGRARTLNETRLIRLGLFRNRAFVNENKSGVLAYYPAEFPSALRLFVGCIRSAALPEKRFHVFPADSKTISPETGMTFQISGARTRVR